MAARQGRILVVDLDPDAVLRKQIADTATDDESREAMLKDCRLLEAALTTDRSVVSLDETARHLFVNAARSVPQIRRLVWVNPTVPAERAENWLERGARPDEHRHLTNGK
jgi:hypothetical protein